MLEDAKGGQRTLGGAILIIGGRTRWACLVVAESGVAGTSTAKSVGPAPFPCATRPGASVARGSPSLPGQSDKHRVDFVREGKDLGSAAEARSLADYGSHRGDRAHSACG